MLGSHMVTPRHTAKPGIAEHGARNTEQSEAAGVVVVLYSMLANKK